MKRQEISRRFDGFKTIYPFADVLSSLKVIEFQATDDPFDRDLEVETHAKQSEDLLGLFWEGMELAFE